MAAFKRRYPKVELLIQQGNPTQICDQVLAGEADMAVATEMISTTPSSCRCRCTSGTAASWSAEAPAPQGEPLTLEKLAEYPIVTYDFAFANRSLVQKASKAADSSRTSC